jgi:hypothetical protein
MLHVRKHTKCLPLHGYVNLVRHNFWSEILSFYSSEISFYCLRGIKCGLTEGYQHYGRYYLCLYFYPRRQCVLNSWWPPSRVHSVIIHKTTIWNENLLLSLISDTQTDILEFINDILTCVTFQAPNDRLQLMYFCDTSNNISIFFLQNLQARVLSSLPHWTNIHTLLRLHSHKLQCTVKQHGLE